MTLEAVTFDFGNTLTSDPDWEAAREARLGHVLAWLRETNADTAEEVVREAFDVAHRAGVQAWSDERRHFGAGDYVEHILLALERADDPRDRARLLALLEEPVPDRRLPAVDGVADALAALREAGLRLGVVSNLAWGPSRVMRRHLDTLGLAGFFEPGAMAFSDEVGVLKPHPAIFMAALDALGTEPAHAAHVGDLKRTDVAGARELGMGTVRYAGVLDDPSDGPEADHVIHDYSELAGVLGL